MRGFARRPRMALGARAAGPAGPFVTETAMPLDASQLSTQASARALSLAAEKLNALSLRQKVDWLRQHRSSDPLQQMQSDAITELYDAVRQIQEAIWPMLLLIPDTSGARDAAAGGSASAVGAAPVTRFAASQFTRRG